MKITRAISLVTLGSALAGCATSPLNPSFSVDARAARAALGEMRSRVKPFPRPVVVVAGYLDPAMGCASVADILRAMTPDPSQVVSVPLFSVSSFESCRRRVIEAVEARFPSDDPARTTDVDMIGISMGGLVARDAAIPRDDATPTLSIRRLFTIATPHRGAEMAMLPTLDQRVADMRPGSEFLRHLNESFAPAEYETVAYVILGDAVVGEENTVPPGGVVHWLPNQPFQFAHLQVHRDPRILADVARRLRGESPFATDPPAPLPE